MKNKEKLLCFIIMVISIIISLMMKSNLIFIQFFSLVYLLLIYKKCGSNTRKFMYFVSLLFAIVSIGNRHHYYLSFLIYILIIIKDNMSSLKANLNKISFKNLNRYEKYIGVFIIYMIVSLIWSPDKMAGISYLIKYLVSITMMFMVIIENRSKNDLEKTFDIFVYLLSGVLLIGTMEIFGLDFGLPNHFADKGIFDRVVQIIPVTFFHNPNNYAVFLVLGLIISFKELFYKVNTKKTLLNFINVILIIINLIFTRSRVGLISTILTLIFIFIFGIINYKKSKIFSKKSMLFSTKYLSLIFVIFFAFAIFPEMSFYCGKFAKMPVIEEIQKIISTKVNSGNNEVKEPSIVIGAEGSDNVRVTLIYDVVVEGLIKDKNVFGVGVGNTGNFLKKLDNTHGTLNVHCLWFELLSDFGVFIFIYTIYIYIRLFFDIFNLRKKICVEKESFYLSGMTMVFVNVFLVFGPSFVISFTPFWISMGILYSILQYYKKTII